MTQHAHEPHTGHTECSEVLMRIYEYLDGELSLDDVRRIAAHLGECGPCLAQHDVDMAVKTLVRRTWSPQPAPTALRVTIVQRITMVRRELDL